MFGKQVLAKVKRANDDDRLEVGCWETSFCQVRGWKMMTMDVKDA